LLTERTVTVQQLWWRGELIASQQRSRASWANAKNSPSGVSGSTGIGVTSSDSMVDQVADKTVRTVADKPHGLFGVDMAYTKRGGPRVTEINVGRFFTTAPEFFAQAGFNMAYVYVKWGMNDPFWQDSTPWRNPIRDGKKWIRGMDRSPVLV
jgi:carbamoyl-phosphate synthase large subunit